MRLSFPSAKEVAGRLGQLSDFQATATPFVLAAATGVGAGLAAVVFRELIELFHGLFFVDIAGALDFMGRSHVILLPALGGLIVGPLIYLFAREAKGHGVPEVMLAVAETGGRIRGRVAVVKSIASAVCIGSGGSAGREGPIVQIGSALASTFGQLLKLDEANIRLLVASGAAGGISATFNAPIAGVFFALEVILRRFSTRNFSVVVLSAVVADVVAISFLGDEPSFAAPGYRLESAWEMPLYALLGVVCAIAGLAFIFLLYKSEDLFDRVRLPEWVKPVVGGLAMGALGLWYADLFGVGYESVNTALIGDRAFLVLMALGGLKILATSLTIGSGGSGGIFAPSLFIGAMAGGAFGEAVHGAFPDVTAASGAYALVGMGAVFAAAARAPITSIIILFEMTRDYHIILPLMTAVVIATLVAQLINRETIYTIKLMRRGIDVQKEEGDYVMQRATVAEAMNKKPVRVPANMTLPSLAELFADKGVHGAPVVDDEGRLLGIVTQGDIQKRLPDAKPDLRAIDIASRQVETVYPDQTLHRIITRPDAWERHQFPVVERDDPSRLVGMLSRSDIVRAYSRLTAQQEEVEQRQRISAIARGPDTRLVTFRVESGSPLIGRELRTISLPTDSVIVSVYRRGRTVIPRGDTVFRAGDQLAILAHSAAEEKVTQSLTSPPPSGKQRTPASPSAEVEGKRR